MADTSRTIRPQPASLARKLEQTQGELARALVGWAATADRLAEADETLRAIRCGEVDALVMTDGEPGAQVFTLASADRPYRIFVENMRDGAATVSAAGVVLYANHRLATILQCSAHQVVGAPIHSFVAPADRALLAVGDHDGTTEIQLVAADGGNVSVLLGTTTIDVEGDQLTCLTFTDLTATKMQEEVIGRLNRAQIEQLKALQDAQMELTVIATHDSLTSLPNRALLLDRIDQALAEATRSRQWTAVIFIDLDRFKHINDQRGHTAGDRVLRQVARRLQATTRPMDTVARIGGDQFVVLTPTLPDQSEATEIAWRIVEGLKTGVDDGGAAEGVTASIGISIAAGGRSSAEMMLQEADTAMCHAKSLGRARTEVFDAALSLRASERVATEDFLQHALTNRLVVPHYQPIVDLSTGHVAGFEALARILRDDDKVLYPDTFIAVAEETGLVVSLGNQMMSAACREAQQWRLAADGRFSRPSPSTFHLANLTDATWWPRYDTFSRRRD